MELDPDAIRDDIAKAKLEAAAIASADAMRALAAGFRAQARVASMTADAIDQQADRRERGEEPPVPEGGRLSLVFEESRPSPTAAELRERARMDLLAAVVQLAGEDEAQATLANVVNEAGGWDAGNIEDAALLMQDLQDAGAIESIFQNGERLFVPTDGGRGIALADSHPARARG